MLSCVTGGQRGLTQRELAMLVWHSQEFVSKVEKGQRSLGLLAARLAAAGGSFTAGSLGTFTVTNSPAPGTIIFSTTYSLVPGHQGAPPWWSGQSGASARAFCVIGSSSATMDSSARLRPSDPDPARRLRVCGRRRRGRWRCAASGAAPGHRRTSIAPRPRRAARVQGRRRSSGSPPASGCRSARRYRPR